MLNIPPSPTRSVWMNERSRHDARPPLRDDASADVCIIGAGIAGVCCAYELARDGARVLLLDAGEVGAGETGRTTAHLTNALDDRYAVIESIHGAETAAVCAQSHTAGIDRIERLADDEGIECGFERLDGFLFLPPGEAPGVLSDELSAAQRAGLSSVERVSRPPAIDDGPALRFPRQAQMHPLRFLGGLARSVERMGGRIHCRTRAVAVERHGDLRVRTADDACVAARSVIVATNSPVSDLFAIHTKQAAHRTYAIAASVPPGAVPRALYWDTAEKAGRLSGPYHYVRVAPGASIDARHDLLIVGGEDHPTGEPEDGAAPWARLESWARARCPHMLHVQHRWSGQVFEPVDRLAFIGRDPAGPEGVYVVTGDSGMGMTHGAIASILLPQLIAGRSHPWEKVYDPARKPMRRLGAYCLHNLHVAAQYADWAQVGAEADSIPPGEGRVVRRGAKLIAAHRDDAGRLHTRSAICTHLGGVLRWNPVERSWDCPCHGSRFDPDGGTLNAPARTPLAPGVNGASERDRHSSGNGLCSDHNGRE